MALEPAAFAGERTLGEDDKPEPWVLHGDVWPENPRFHLRPEDSLMLMVWRRCRPGPLGGPEILPCPGGVLDQPLVMLQALDEMEHASTKFRRRPDAPPGEA